MRWRPCVRQVLCGVGATLHREHDTHNSYNSPPKLNWRKKLELPPALNYDCRRKPRALRWRSCVRQVLCGVGATLLAKLHSRKMFWHYILRGPATQSVVLLSTGIVELYRTSTKGSSLSVSQSHTTSTQNDDESSRQPPGQSPGKSPIQPPA